MKARKFALVLVPVLLATLFAGCGGGGGSKQQLQNQGPPDQGQIQILNNMPTHIERIEVGLAGSGAPKQDRLLGVLLPGSSFTIGLAEGVYDIDVWVWDQPFGYIQSYTEVVTSGNVQTIVATP